MASTASQHSSSKSSSVASDSVRTRNLLVLCPTMGSVMTEVTERIDRRLDRRPSKHSSSDEFSSLFESVLERASIEVDTTGVKCENLLEVTDVAGLAYLGIPCKYNESLFMNHAKNNNPSQRSVFAYNSKIL